MELYGKLGFFIFIYTVSNNFSNGNTISSLSPTFVKSQFSVSCKKGVSHNLVPCPVPVAQLRKGRFEPGNIGPIRTSAPPWFNKTLALVAQQFYKENLAGFSFGQVLAFIVQSTSTDFRRIFLGTGNSTNSVQSAKRRYLKTYLYALQEIRSKLPDELNPDEDEENEIPLDYEEVTFISVFNSVRFLHEVISFEAQRYSKYLQYPIIEEQINSLSNPKNINLRVWDAFENDIHSSKSLAKYKSVEIFPPKTGLPTPYMFNQFGVAIEYWALVAPVVLFPEKLFMRPTAMEQLAHLHFFGVGAYIFGVKTEYNVCLQPSLEEAKKYYKEMLEVYLLPGLFHLDYETKVLVEMVIKGLNEIVKVADLGTVLQEFLRMLDIPTPNLRRALTPIGRINSQAIRIGKSLAHYPFYRNLATSLVNGMVQLETMKEFGINIFESTNFTNGFIELSEDSIKYAKLWNIKLMDERLRKNLHRT